MKHLWPFIAAALVASTLPPHRAAGSTLPDPAPYLERWAHPTNTIPQTVMPIDVFWGDPVGGTADSWPHNGVCNIRLNQQLWDTAPQDVRDFVMMHEVGHCLGMWLPENAHTGNGIMGCGYIVDAFETCLFTAHDQFLADSLHPSTIQRRVVVGGLTLD